MDRHIKVAFLTLDNFRDKTAWSGTFYSISKSLEKHLNGDLYYIEPVNALNRILIKILVIFNFFLKKSFKKEYIYLYNKSLCKNLSRYIEKELEEKYFDLIFAPAVSSELAFLNTKIPIIYLSDATFNLLFYSDNKYADTLKISLKEGDFIEKSAIEKSDMIIYSSKWAAESAINDYSADKTKVHIVPFGANIEEIPPKDLVINKKKSNFCNLLFLGVDWERKGGKIAFETLLELEKRNISATLTVCGCVPPEEFFHERMKIIPFLDKNDNKQAKKLSNLFLKSDFLILPTRIDATPIVFCEANAFGLPVITTNVGGISDVIEQGKNGYMLPLDALASDYADLIKKIFLDNEQYQKLVRSSRKTFDEKLNWDFWGITVSELINKLIKTS